MYIISKLKISNGCPIPWAGPAAAAYRIRVRTVGCSGNVQVTRRDGIDNCPNISNFSQSDSDDDGIGNSCDNCIAIFNPDQIIVN